MWRRDREKGLYIGVMFERAAARHGSTSILLDSAIGMFPESGESVTFSTLADHVSDIANRLWAAGVRPTDRVAIYKSHNFDIVLLACAVARIGAVALPIHPDIDGDTVAAMLDRVTPRPFLITDQSMLSTRLHGVSLTDISQECFLSTGEDAAVRSLDDFGGAQEREPVLMHPDQPVLISHTSGTTGVPKLVVHTARSLGWRFRPQVMLASFLRSRDPVAFCLSFVHSRIFSGLAVVLEHGLPALVVTDPSPERVADLFVQRRPALVETFPNTFLTWEVLTSDPREPLSSVRCYTSTFDAMHPRTVARLLRASRRLFPLFVQFYAQSEVGPIAVMCYASWSAGMTDGRCVGIPLPWMTKVRIVGPYGEPRATGEAGAIEVRSNGRARTYLGQEDRFERQVDGPWWRTGDVGFRNRWGLLHMLDREVDQIPLVVSALAIEDKLMSRLEELTEVIVIPGPAGETIPVICTHGDRPLDKEAWWAATNDAPGLGSPVHLRLDQLPRTATWKIKRHELVQQLRNGNVLSDSSL